MSREVRGICVLNWLPEEFVLALLGFAYHFQPMRFKIFEVGLRPRRPGYSLAIQLSSLREQPAI